MTLLEQYVMTKIANSLDPHKRELKNAYTQAHAVRNLMPEKMIDYSKLNTTDTLTKGRENIAGGDELTRAHESLKNSDVYKEYVKSKKSLPTGKSKNIGDDIRPVYHEATKGYLKDNVRSTIAPSSYAPHNSRIAGRVKNLMSRK